MENCSSHGCNCCPPWWVTMGFIPPLQNRDPYIPIRDPRPIVTPPPPQHPGYTPPEQTVQPPVGIGVGGDGYPRIPNIVQPPYNPQVNPDGTPRVPNTGTRPNPLNPVLDIFNPLTGPLNPFGSIIKNLFGGIG